jgi:two-component system chemotaxis response regulator CheY
MILIAEDDKQVQKAYVRLLRGAEVTVCDCAADAYERIKEGLRPDAIISDLDMPHMLGSTFCQLVRDLGLKTPFMLVSGNPDVEGLAKDCGADAWAVKGLDPPSKLIDFVTRHVGVPCFRREGRS